MYARLTLRTLLTCAALVFSTALWAADQGSGARAAFEQLSSLVGTWEGAFPDGRKHRLVYRFTAANSVLVETWTLGPDRESMTLYHMDGEDLIATHYCPQGNQPRLRFLRGDSTHLTFAFLDGTNLQVSGKEHQHSFWLHINSRDKFTRSEAYALNGTLPTAISGPTSEVVTYRRIVDE